MKYTVNATSVHPIETAYQSMYPMDLSCNGYKGETMIFKVELLTYAIDSLIEATNDIVYL